MHRPILHSGERLHGERLGHIYTPEVLIFPSPEGVDSKAAEVVIDQVNSKPNSVITLPTGSTPVGMYRLLSEAFRKGEVDFSGVKIFNLDAYWPISHVNPASYVSFMREIFFNHVNIPPEQRFIPNGMCADPDEEAERYEALLKQYGPPDLAVLGIGPGKTCHIGFNERGSMPDSRVRRVDLDEETRKVNAAFFQEGEPVPTSALTQGIADILDAQRILLLAKGKGKAWGVQRTLEGEIGPDAPASYLRYHPQTTFILDQDAASLLS